MIDAARSPGHAPQKAETGTAADWVLDAARDVGLDLDGYSHVIDGSAVRHIFKKHGVEGVEQTRGQIAVKDQDILSIGTIIGDPDAVAFGTKTAQHKDAVIYAKIMPDGTTTVVEELRTGRSEAAVVSMWKRPAAKDPDALSRILLSYARSDGGTPIKVVTKADGVKEQRDLSSLKASLSRSKGRALGMIGKDGWKTTTALFSNWLSDAMGKDERWNALGLVPGRALFAELGKNLPAAAEYLGLKERMDADRNDWQARSAKMVDKWTAAVLTPRETDGQRVHRGVQQQA